MRCQLLETNRSMLRALARARNSGILTPRRRLRLRERQLSQPLEVSFLIGGPQPTYRAKDIEHYIAATYPGGYREPIDRAEHFLVNAERPQDPHDQEDKPAGGAGVAPDDESMV